ncbi:MAG TPA: hypothetical protein VGE47_04220 [Burkholderiaceae bacterium]
MNMDVIALLLGVGLVLALAGLAVSWLWFRRRLATAGARQAKLEKARQFAEQQGTQARRQTEQLQKELADLRMQLSRYKPLRKPEPGEVKPEVEDLLLAHAHEAPAAPTKVVDPFADTLLVAPNKR